VAIHGTCCLARALLTCASGFRAADALVGLLTSIGGDRAEAEEVAQDAYVKLVQRWSEVSRYASPEAWLRTVAVRLLISRKRRAKSWLTASLRHSSEMSGQVPEPSADSVAVAQALSHLSLDHRSVLMLHHGLDLPVDEVAALLQILSEPSNLASPVLARRSLRCCLNKRCMTMTHVDELIKHYIDDCTPPTTPPMSPKLRQAKSDQQLQKEGHPRYRSRCGRASLMSDPPGARIVRSRCVMSSTNACPSAH
jgi:RNA polymerase sigma-70 factor (ECF subfamily)